MMIFIASLLAGIGMGVFIPGVFARVSELSNLKKGISFVGFVVAAQGLGGICGPFIFFVFLNALGKEVGRFPLLITAVGLIGLGVVMTVFILLGRGSKNVDIEHAETM